MAYFKRDRFGGIAPGVAPRLLAESFGQVAENVDVESGRLVALKNDINVDINTTLNSNAHEGKLDTFSKKSLILTTYRIINLQKDLFCHE